MSFETKCYFLHGCKWEKKDGKRHNTCQAPDTEPCKYKYLSEKPKTQTEKIAETLAARDKWFIKTIEDRFGDGHDKPLIQIGVQDWRDFKADKEWVEWVENNMHFCKKPDGAGCSYECNECDHNANYIKWQSRRKEIGL